MSLFLFLPLKEIASPRIVLFTNFTTPILKNQKNEKINFSGIGFGF